MKFKLVFASAAAIVALAGIGHAATTNQLVIYNVDAAAQCSGAAASGEALRQGLEHCNVALGDPLMNHRGALLVNRGIIKAKMDDASGAMADYNAAIAMNPQTGDAYVNRAAILISMKRYDEARTDLAKGMQLGGENMAAAYFSRAAIEDDLGNYQAAYRDYKQALALNPDYAAAKRELARYKVAPRTAAN